MSMVLESAIYFAKYLCSYYSKLAYDQNPVDMGEGRAFTDLVGLESLLPVLQVCFLFPLSLLF